MCENRLSKRQRPTNRSLLEDALANALKATKLDEQLASGPAIKAYAECIEQMDQVLERISDHGPANEYGTRRIKEIRDNYYARMEVLSLIAGQEANPVRHTHHDEGLKPSGAEAEKKLPLNRVEHAACMVDLEKGHQHAHGDHNVGCKRTLTVMLVVAMVLSGIFALVGKHESGMTF
ncbi:hypothetical protein FRC12_024296 [Ceratobasidium sp. 428]|nr:hypothetical protein FRC12_024296 [Ceratobasidium sp. 428]